MKGNYFYTGVMALEPQTDAARKMIAEMAWKVEVEYTPQPHTRITPKLAARLSAKLNRKRKVDKKEIAVVLKFAARIQHF